ncbi:winged helix DNA-binding domain-containing protein [Trujillonella endophytica]|uniref:Winged helix DNA-binding domain-containing protein n=1 Tax=Trujillonella endophytica TaxID=673521 RepID=A0A1H8UTK6_9ACTN|nr:winged helix DNA-binding domain-containing protein [Trujillella endophytica]SEP06525.1 Winged helix DNA-binding domain-containing protein [Trujillella endophytica]
MTTSPRELARLRLVAQRLAGAPAASAAEAVRGLLCAQGQDLPGAVTSVALRTRDRSATGVRAAFDAGEVVRSWPMRGTLHLLPAEELPWLLELCGPRAVAGAAKRRAALGITDRDVDRAREQAVGALTGGRRLGRAALLAAIGEAVDVSGQRGYHLLWFLAQTGTLVLGPTEGTDQAFALLDEWVPAPRRLSGEEALAELARRYLTGHGPATDADLARWAGLTLRDVRAGIAAVRSELAAVEVDGRELLMAPDLPDRLAACRSEVEDAVLLLPGFDEYVLGYADRTCAVPEEFAERIVPGRNGMFRSTVVHGGRVLGVWRWAGSGSRRVPAPEPFTTFPDRVAAAIPELAAALP